MEDEEDEEVVFEGSAIHQHLLDLGYSDFEQSAYVPPVCQDETQLNTTLASQTKSGWVKAGREWCLAFPHHLFGTPPMFVQSYIYTTVAKAVSRSRLVNEDDWLVLEHFLPDGEELRASANTPVPWPTSACRGRDVVVIVMCLLLPWMVTSDWLVLFSLLVVVLVACGLYCMYWREKMASLKELVLNLKEMNHFTSKTVRLLQEMDLIGKGFVLAQGPGAPLATQYEESPHMSCLSESLLGIMTAAAKILVSAHIALHHKVPHYPAIRHLFDEPPSLEQDCTHTQHMQYLKSRVTVIKLQTSAVLTELLLWLYRSGNISEYRTVVEFITTSYKKDVFIEQIQSLKKQYEYNKCFWLTERPAVNVSRSLEEKKKNVYVAVHSLGLHLQAALVRVQSLESKFERESDTSSLCEPESLEAFPSYEHFKAQLTALRLELDLCQGCVEEAEVRGARKYEITDEHNTQKSSVECTAGEEEDIELANVTKPPVVLLYDQQVAPAEDEVFEAQVEDRLADQEASVPDDDDVWCTDARKERQVLRQQKEQGKRVLRELQPILTSRRKMWEEREKVALEKLRTRPVEQNMVQVIEKKEHEGQGKDAADDEHNTTPVNIEQLNIAALRSFGSGTATDDEVDSDEERLTAYRKIKQELDEDEERRIANEVRLNAATSHSLFQTDIGRGKDLSSDYEDTVSEEDTVSVLRLRHSGTSHKVFPSWRQNNCEIFTDCAEETEDKVDDQNIRIANSSPGNRSTETKLRDFEVYSSGDDERTEEPSCEEGTPVEEETFTHNENMKDDESHEIDWTTFTLPTHLTASLDDRLNLYSGRSCLGFQAEVAAQASAASKTFWKTMKQTEETFGGTGEGEEFGSSSDEED